MNKEEGSEIARTEVTRALISYIETNHLQNETNKKLILPDEKLKGLLGLEEKDELTYFNLQKYMNKHFIKSSITSTSSSSSIEKSIQYFELLEKWNKTHDLVAPSSIDKLIAAHFIDSLSAFAVSFNAQIFPKDSSSFVYADIGTGGGIPGVFWHLFFKDMLPQATLSSYLVEPREKRISFLEEVRRQVIPEVNVFKGNFTEFVNLLIKQDQIESSDIIFSLRALKPENKELKLFDSSFNQLTNKANIIWLAGVNSEYDETWFSPKVNYFINEDGSGHRVILSKK